MWMALYSGIEPWNGLDLMRRKSYINLDDTKMFINEEMFVVFAIRSTIAVITTRHLNMIH